MVKYLYAGWAGTGSNSGSFDAPGYTWGNRFGVTGTVDQTATGFRVYTFTGGNRPAWLRLWDVTSNTQLAYLALTGTPSTGWNSYPLPSSVTLTAGHAFEITGYWAGGTVLSATTAAARGTPDVPLAWDDLIGWYASGDVATVVTSTHNDSQSPLMDLVLEGTGGGGAGSGSTTVTGDLSSWLSTDAAINAHKSDGTPWQTWQDNLALVSRISQVTSGDVTTYGLRSQDLSAALIKALAFLVANADKLDIIKSWFTGTRNPATSDAIDVILNRIDLQTANGQSHSQWESGAILDPALNTEVDSFPFAGQVGWGSGYALHRVHLDTSDDQHPMIDLGAAGFWVPGVGWWAATLPDGSLTNRRPLEFADQWLWPVPAAATGLVLWCHPATTGTIYAYSVP